MSFGCAPPDRRHRAIGLFLGLALGGLCASRAEASYGQMGLPLGTAFSLMLVAGWTAIVDYLLLIRLFRWVVCLVASTVVSLLLVMLLVATWDDSHFLTRINPWEVFALLLVPFMIAAPFVQHAALAGRLGSARATRRATVGIHLAIALQLVVPASLFGIDRMQSAMYVQSAERAGERGQHAKSGEVKALLASVPIGTWEASESMKGLEKTALIRGNTPLVPDDRDALLAFVKAATFDHYYGYYEQVETKLLWDALQPAKVPDGLSKGPVAELLVLVGPESRFQPPLRRLLTDYIEPYAALRLCPDGRMLDTDRAALDALYAAREEAARKSDATWHTTPSEADTWKALRERLARVCGG